MLSSFWDDVSAVTEGKGAWHGGKLPLGSRGSSCCSIPLPSRAGRGSPSLHVANSTFALGESREVELLLTSASPLVLPSLQSRN